MKTNSNFYSQQSIESLCVFFDTLESNYDNFNIKESVKQEVAILKGSIADCMNGSREAETYLNEHGLDILANVEKKLGRIIDEQGSLQNEMSLLNGITEKKVEVASKAVASTEEVRSAFEDLIYSQ